MRAISACAASSETPERVFPKTISEGPSPRGVATGSERSATQTSWFCGKRNPSGMTPMIVPSSPLIFAVRPRTAGSLP